jgi:hypothetical protein
MILKIFSPKNSAKKLSFLTQNKAKLCKILIITLVFEKNTNFFAENCQKLQKIVIITSVPGIHTYVDIKWGPVFFDAKKGRMCSMDVCVKCIEEKRFCPRQSSSQI